MSFFTTDGFKAHIHTFKGELSLHYSFFIFVKFIRILESGFEGIGAYLLKAGESEEKLLRKR